MAASTTSADFDPTQQAISPTMQVFTHIIDKGYQAGSAIGACVVVPVTAAYASLYRKQAIDQLQLLRKVGVSCATGVVLTGLLGAAKLYQIDQDGMIDRAYRLHYNESQNRTDLFSAYGAAAGLAAGGLMLRKPASAMHYLGASGVGVASGVVLHVLTRPAEHKMPDRMMHELKT